MHRPIPILLVALLTWLTTATAQNDTRPPLRAPAGQCEVETLVNGIPAKEAVVGD